MQALAVLMSLVVTHACDAGVKGTCFQFPSSFKTLANVSTAAGTRSDLRTM